VRRRRWMLTRKWVRRREEDKNRETKAKNEVHAGRDHATLEEEAMDFEILVSRVSATSEGDLDQWGGGSCYQGERRSSRMRRERKRGGRERERSFIDNQEVTQGR
jgi:hypothetical protein